MKSEKRWQRTINDITAIVFIPAYLITIFFITYTFSSQDIHDMLEEKEILATSQVNDLMIFVVETDDPHFTFSGHEFRANRQILVFSKNTLLPRYRLSIRSSFNEVHASIFGDMQQSLQWWQEELTFSGGFHRYIVNIHGTTASEGFDIRITQDGIRPMSFHSFTFWVFPFFCYIFILIMRFRKRLRKV